MEILPTDVDHLIAHHHLLTGLVTSAHLETARWRTAIDAFLADLDALADSRRIDPDAAHVVQYKLEMALKHVDLPR